MSKADTCDTKALCSFWLENHPAQHSAGNNPIMICFQRNDFQSSFSASFKALRDDLDFIDVTLVCDDGQNVSAHQVKSPKHVKTYLNKIKCVYRPPLGAPCNRESLLPETSFDEQTWAPIDSHEGAEFRKSFGCS